MEIIAGIAGIGIEMLIIGTYTGYWTDDVGRAFDLFDDATA